MSINIKKYTKDQMAKMVEDAQAEVQELKRVNATVTEQISQMNGEDITRENVIANLRGRTPFFSFIFLFFRERVLYAGCIYVVCM